MQKLNLKKKLLKGPLSPNVPKFVVSDVKDTAKTSKD